MVQPAFGHGQGDAGSLDLSTASDVATPQVEQVVINPCDEGEFDRIGYYVNQCRVLENLLDGAQSSAML